MGKQRQRNRIRSKIDDLSPEIRAVVDAMLVDTRNTYDDISAWLADRDFEVSRSSIGRYALRTNTATQRLLEAQEQTKALVKVIEKNPDADYTEGALQIMSGELTKRMAQAQEEWDNMPLDKAARVMVSLSRTKAYKDKIRVELASKVKTAVGEFKKQLYAELEKVAPDICERLTQLADGLANQLEAEE
jgi:hypothetical protein